MPQQELYAEVVTDLRAAYRLAKKNKAGAGPCVRCMMELEEVFDGLARQIINGTYAPRPSVCFVVTNPVPREIIAADFSDRIVHHYVFRYLDRWLERELIDDCYSCRKGKGTAYGVDRLEHHIRACSQNYTRECWVLQLDINGYFMNIDRWKLYVMAMELMSRIGRRRDGKGRRLDAKPKHRLIERLLATLILHDPLSNCTVRDREGLLSLLPPSKSLRFSPEGCGLPIGNLTSQMFSNLYMNVFDQWVKRGLRVKHYGRYVDDSYYVSVDRERLLALVPKIDDFLQRELGLHLNLAKTKLTEARQGVSFLGVHLKPYRRYVKRRTMGRIRGQVSRMREVSQTELARDEVRQHLLSSANSFLGVLGHTASYKLRRELFGSYPMYVFAHGTRGMRKFELNDVR